jgi:hypothetical protein
VFSVKYTVYTVGASLIDSDEILKKLAQICALYTLLLHSVYQPLNKHGKE